MYLLYLDESGNHGDAEHFVLAGVAVFERNAYWLKKDLNEVVQHFLPETHADFVLHASQLRVSSNTPRTDLPDQLTGPQSRELLDASYRAIAAYPYLTLFATIVRKQGVGLEEDPYETAFTDIVSRFDLMLARRRDNQDVQRGLVIIAESNYRERLELLSDQILRDGTQWGEMRNFADIPLFAPAKRTRLLQAADLVANAVWGSYEKGLSRDFQRLVAKFDREGDRLHGLTHLGVQRSTCMCQACISWRVYRSPSTESTP